MEVNEILDKNEVPLKKLYEYLHHGRKKYMTLRDSIELVNGRAQMKMTENCIGNCFAFSMMTVLDALKDGARANQMKYVEFLEFIGRISYEYFRGKEEETLYLYEKIDRVLSILFRAINTSKTFSILPN